MPNGKPISINRITVPRPYDVLANQLRETILRGEISAGESLPAERQLVAQTGLSRGSVREALRTLAMEGLIETKRGRTGGNVVTMPNDKSMSNAIVQYVRGRRLPLRVLHEAREALEPTLARLAANHRTAEDLQILRSLHADLIASVADFQAFSLVNIRWHNAVAKASGNELLAGFLHSLSYGLMVSTTTEEYDTPDTREAVIKVHGRINDAIAAQDADSAERRMRQHIRATHDRAAASGTTSVQLSSGVKR